jgi:transcriptional regulator with XRE-family HTH domain
MTRIAKNIKHLRGLKNWSQTQMADALQITRSRIGSYEEERCDPPVDVLIRISELFHIAIDALVKCDLSTVDPGAMIKLDQNRILFPIVVDKDNNDRIEVLTVNASAGYLRGYSDPEFIEQLPAMTLPFEAHGKLRGFPIKGDSMPPLMDGSYVVGKFVEFLKDVRDGSTCILVTKDEGIVYKRVHKKGYALELHSDNPNYKPYLVKVADILEIWEFVCSLSLSDKKHEEPSMQSMMEMLQGMKKEIQKLNV